MKGNGTMNVLLAILCLAAHSAVAAVGTSFTYQGRIKDGSSWASGQYDFQFKLYDAASNGTQLGSANAVGSVEVTDGFLTVSVDFGSVFTGDARWLQTEVKPVGASSYTTLTPRQELKPVPYAMYATNGGGGGGSGGWTDNGTSVYVTETSRKVGVGTATPASWSKMEVDGVSWLNGDVRVGSTASVTKIAGPAYSGAMQITTNGTTGGDGNRNLKLGHVDNNGTFYSTMMVGGDTENVGLGTITPQEKLEVNGAIRVSTGATDTDYISFGWNYGGLRLYRAAPATLRLDNAAVNGANQALTVRTSNTSLLDTTSLVILGNGNVGIGTTQPSTALHAVSGSTSYTWGSGMRIQRSDTSTSGQKLGLSFLSSNGYIEGAIGMRNTGANGYGDFYVSTRQSDTFAEAVTVTCAGDVGIGTTSPSEKLHVVGTARLEGIGSSTGTTVVADSNGKLWKSSSSRRYKTDIRGLGGDPSAVLDLQPVAFHWKTTGQADLGVIAEDVEKILPDLVIYDNEGRPDAVKYDKIALYLLQVVKTQQEQIRHLEHDNEALKQQVTAGADVAERLERLEKMAAGGASRPQQAVNTRP